MRIAKFIMMFIMASIFIWSMPTSNYAKEKQAEESLTLPKHIFSIGKENTFPNPTEEIEVIEPSDATEALLKNINIKIENPHLIKLLNESMVKTTPFSFGTRANIYIGRWALNYDSKTTSIIWDYHKVNENEINNKHSSDVQELRYNQAEDKEVKGALTNKIDDPQIIKTMMLQKLKDKLDVKLSFTTKVGANTTLNNFYHVPTKKFGLLEAYIPAINEKGEITYGEVYIQLKGSKYSLEIKNVTKQGIGAWIPIQDHIALSFTLK